jgi:ElaB/YqjD/DUF883 family membrane-anchored ribosome-binding protein
METQSETHNGQTAAAGVMEDEVAAARKALEDFNQKAVSFIRERPGTCIAGAVLLGFVLGRLVSRR